MAFTRYLSAGLILGLALALSFGAARATEVFDPMTGPKLDIEWAKELSPKSKGTIEITPEGVAMKVERRHFAWLKRRCPVAGTDQSPLDISVEIKTEPTEPATGLVLYWDNDNFISIRPVDAHIYAGALKANVWQEHPFYNIFDKTKSVYVRVVLTSHNAMVFAGPDGLNWRKLDDLGGRPVEGIPPKIMLGRGWQADKNDPNRKPDLANDYYIEPNNKPIQTTIFRNFRLYDGTRPMPNDAPALEKKDNWQQSLDEVETLFTPPQWTLLGPRPDKDYRLVKQPLIPDQTDDWTKPLNDESGSPFKLRVWKRPEGDLGCQVNLAEILDIAHPAMGYARAEIDWPMDGPAYLWFDTPNAVSISHNGHVVFQDLAPNQWRPAFKDARSVALAMKKGKNYLKLKLSTNGGGWWYFARLERMDPGYRILLLEKLLELYPEEAGAWRGVEARLEIIRRYVQMNNFPGACAAAGKAVEAFAQNEEARAQALAEWINLLESLRDWDGLASAGNSYLTKHPRDMGFVTAMRACVLGEVLSGKGDAAEARVKQWLDAHGGDAREAWVLRLLANAYAASGQQDKGWATLERITDRPTVSADERARAAFDAAVGRLYFEIDRVNRNEKLDPNRLPAACHAAQKGIACLPGAKNPMVQAFVADAEADLKAGKIERAALGYWGAMYLCWCASDPTSAYHMAISKGYKLPSPTIDPKTGTVPDMGAFQRDRWKIITPAFAGPVKAGDKWRAIGPFDAAEGAALSATFGPEANPDYNAKFNGRGGQKGWVEIDPAKGGTEFGTDLNQFLGDCRGGCAFVGIDLDVAQATTTNLNISERAGWAAYLDGQLLQAKPEDGFTLDGTRMPLDLKPGHHHLVVKLLCPGDGPLSFRVRVDDEPEVGMNVLLLCWATRELNQIRFLQQWRGDFEWWMGFAYNKINADAYRTLGEAYWIMFPNIAASWRPVVLQRTRDAGEYADASDGLRSLLMDYEAELPYPERDDRYWGAVNMLATSLIAEGEPGAADEILKECLARYPSASAYYGEALVRRGCLRRDFSIAQAGQAFFDRAFRGYNFHSVVQQHTQAAFSVMGQKIEYGQADINMETESAIKAAERQLGTRTPEDVERAVRNLSEVLRSGVASVLALAQQGFYPRYVGARERVRLLLSNLKDDSLETYRKAVSGASEQQFSIAQAAASTTGLEATAQKFPNTSAGVQALNHAANLYMDRGQYAQSASLLRLLLRDYKGSEFFSEPAAVAKLGRCLALDGQYTASKRQAEILAKDYAAEKFDFAGRPVSGQEYAATLRAFIDKIAAGVPTEQASGTDTYMGGPARAGAPLTSPAPQTGPVAWARLSPASASMDFARSCIWPDPFSHLQSHPIAAGGKVFLTSLEGVQAIDQASGQTAWSEVWSSNGAFKPRLFSGFPTSCPTVRDGYLFMRAYNGARTSIQCFRTDSGRQRWTTAGLPEFRDSFWISDPVVAYGLAIAEYVDVGDQNLHGIAALDAETGRLRWKRPLMTGNTGFKAGNDYLPTTFHVGPPAADAGTLFVTTGVGAIAAVNAFSGEVVWMTAYPRLGFQYWEGGNSGIQQDFRLSYVKLLAREPGSPVVAEDVVIVAPRDSMTLLALDRATGQVRWKQELFDERFVAGTCEDLVLVVDGRVRGLKTSNGETAWSYDLKGERCFGAPGYSGGVLYVPTSEALYTFEARTGKLRARQAWDPRVGPLGNLLVLPDRVVGVGEQKTAALAPNGAGTIELPYFEAQGLEQAGKLEEAAQRYLKAAETRPDEFLPALRGRIRVLERLGKQPEALADVDRLLAGKEGLAKAPDGLWKISYATLSEALHTRLGAPAPPEQPVTGELSGTPVYAWHLDGTDPKLSMPTDGPQDRFFVQAGNFLYHLRASAKLDVLWQAYFGSDLTGFRVGKGVVAAWGAQRAVFFDRDTGEQIWEKFVPTDKKKRRARAAGGFSMVGMDEQYAVLAAAQTLFCFDLRTGKERWANEWRNGERRTIFLGCVGGKCVEINGHSGIDMFVSTYDLATGNLVSRQNLWHQTHATWAYPSPDGKYVIVRPFANKLAAIDLSKGTKAWEIDVLNLFINDWPNYGLEFDGNNIVYWGESREGGERGWFTYLINLTDGKVLRKVSSGHWAGNSFVQFSDAWGKTISRTDEENGQPKRIWQVTLPDQQVQGFNLQKVNAAKDRLYLLFAQSIDWPWEQFTLRVMDWNTGLLIRDEYLPGIPPRRQDRSFKTAFFQRGNLLLYTAQDGLYALQFEDSSREEAAAKVRTRLAEPALSAGERRAAHRSLALLDMPGIQAFLAPNAARADGNFAEWATQDPVALEKLQDFVPLVENAEWHGKDDLSARVHCAWNQEGLLIAVEVRDDKFVAPTTGSGSASGDSVRVYLNGYSYTQYGFDKRENVSCWLGRVDGRGAVVQETASPEGSDAKVSGTVVPAPDGKGMRYELFVPWAIVRVQGHLRPGDRKDLRLGVAVYDDDGEGVKGALEWGGAFADGELVPGALGQVSLLDISREKIERFRKVIAKIPDSAEAKAYIDLILLSKRGPKADQERIEELEGLVKTYAQTQLAAYVLSRLRNEYQRAGDANPTTRVVAFGKSANVAPQVLGKFTDQAFRIWVLPDAKTPPAMLMVQFNLKNGGWCRRAYWGEPRVDWGRDQTPERMPMGKMPKPGEWTQLEIRPVDFGMDDEQVVGVAFTSFGGLLHWDQATVQSPGGQQLTLVEDGLPDKFHFEGNPLQFVDNPKKSGAKSWTGGPTSGVLNSHMSTPDGTPWFSFSPKKEQPAPTPVDAAKIQAVYRDAASLVPDTPEAQTFLMRVIDQYPPADRVRKGLGEIEAFLKKNPSAQPAIQLISIAQDWYRQTGEPNPLKRCEELMQTCNLARDVRRNFYKQYTSIWYEWHVIGPWQAQGERRGMEVPTDVEKNIDHVDLEKKHKGPFDLELAWMKVNPKYDDKGKQVKDLPPVIDLNHFLLVKQLKSEATKKRDLEAGPHFAYAFKEVTAADARSAWLYFGAQDMANVWVNGKKVVNERQTWPEKDQQAVAIQLKKGKNEILIKIGCQNGKLSFAARIADEFGQPIEGLPKE